MIIRSSVKLGIRALFLATFFLLVFASRGMTLDVNAKTCSKSDVQSAITQVQSAGGGTVNIPPGDCTWSGPRINIDLNGSIEIIGAGRFKTGSTTEREPIDTILRLNPDSTSKGFFGVNENQTNKIIPYSRISGMSLYSTGRAAIKAGGTTNIYVGKAVTYRIDNLYIESDGGSSTIVIKNGGKGVIDSNHFKRVLTGVPAYDEAYMIEYGSSYTPYSSKPKEVCDTKVCQCDVGGSSIARTSSIASDNTVIVRLYEGSSTTGSAAAVINNTGGSGTGTVQRIYIYLNSVSTHPSLDVAAFTNITGNTFTTRGYARNITTSRGETGGLSNQTVPLHPGLNILLAGYDFAPFTINNGDYIGVHINNCTLSSGAGVVQGVASATGKSWVAPGNQIPCSNQNFGTPSAGGVSLYAEIYDSEGAMAACEANWDKWYASTDPARGGGTTPRPYDENWVPGGDDAQFVENNVFDVLKSDVCANWGSMHKIVWRYNTMNHLDEGEYGGQVFLGFKPGTMFSQVYGNKFNYIGTASKRPSSFNQRVSGLVYNNTFNGVGAFNIGFDRHFSDFYFTYKMRQKHHYLFNNTYNDSSCSSDGIGCVQAFDSPRTNGLVGENGTYFFRAPQPGEILYGFKEYQYPHPLRGESVGSPLPPDSGKYTISPLPVDGGSTPVVASPTPSPPKNLHITKP